MNRTRLTALLLLFFVDLHAEDALMSKPPPDEKAPSYDQVLWTDTHIAMNSDISYIYTGNASTSFGGGRQADVENRTSLMEHRITSRALMAFLFSGGVEWERNAFRAPSSLPVADTLQALDFPVIVDFRWSQHDMVRLQTFPGFYSDFSPLDSKDFNSPVSVGYTRIFSKRFQIGLGVSWNSWRSSPWLGGGGLRWQINDRWKLKFLLPRPVIEYRAAEPLHLSVGSDFRGNTFRTGEHFGSERADPRLNDALVDFQEVRVFGGFSWNIKPLLALQGEVGYLLDREINFHNEDVRSTSGKAPYLGVHLRYLFQLVPDKRSIPQQLRSLENEYPWMRGSIRSHL